ncbi:ABC transporter ATP-binding protein [Phycisphaerales bacterium AB-hyl4]|uniref:ABC transporter ATP-binding protein n=1 Tax=Natronomicrosphaera hydrolytica TaxID=3242702 RepID=A0ABV4U6V2_9BACT
MARPAPSNSTAVPSAKLSTRDDASTGRLILRMLTLTWRFRWGAIKLVIFQAFMLAMALSGLGLVGLGVDVLRDTELVRQALPSDEIKEPRWPFGFEPPPEWTTFGVISAIAGLIFVIALMRFALDRVTTVAKARLVQDIVVYLRTHVYDKLQRLSFRFFDANESGSIINRVTGDVQAVRRFVDGVMVEVLMLVLSLTFFLTYMLSIHTTLTLACLATTPLLWVLTAMFSRIVKPAYRLNRELYDTTIRVLAENVQAVHVVKGFSRQKQETAKFAAANHAVRDQKQWIFWRVATFGPLISFVPQINLAVLLVFGGYIYINDPEFTLGMIVVFSGLLQQFSTQVGNIAQIANSVQQSLTGAQRVFEVLDAPVEITSPADPVPLGRAAGAVRFENVSFSYGEHSNGEAELQDISFDVQPGQSVAVVGATGAGKTSLLSLIPRFYDPQHGRVLVDGVDVREYEIDDLRRNIGLVFQESFLFSNTVAANIAFGHPTATREQIEQAAKIAQAHDFVMELPKGYDTVLGERASNLSGGQQQRLAIARAILLEPPILLLDDPTAAIDPQTEHEILAAMNNAMQGRTTFVVAHRLSTLRRADLVIVLERGRIVQTGTHEELMNSRGHYRKAARLQIPDDESRRLLGMPEAEAETEADRI